MNNDGITRIFCDVDDFCTKLEGYCKTHLLPTDTGGAWFPYSRLTLSEVMTIAILFHLSGSRCFKWYYKEYVGKQISGYFPHPVGYNRFVKLMSYSTLPPALYTQLFRRGKPRGIGFIDSTPVKVCHNRRIYQHKVFKGYAERGKSSTGWFYGFKLHLIINDRGEICAFYLSRGNVDDRNPAVIDHLCRELWGKLCGDRGYISRELFERLYRRGIKLITRLRRDIAEFFLKCEFYGENTS
ncbi:MAG: IS982 family transposase [Treponema sp.]|jgi:hypothetical protein|nr:IS982 family transposase [Treponema sp.]